MLDVVTVTFNSPRLSSAFSNLAREPDFQLYVFDNASTQAPNVPAHAKLFRAGENKGFGAACNQILDIGKAPYILFLNPDCEIDVATARALLDIARADPTEETIVSPRAIGHVGQRVLPAGREPTAKAFFVQYLALGRVFPRHTFNVYDESLPEVEIDVDWVGGGCLMMGRALFARLGGFAPTYFLYGEDVDLCLRARDVGASIRLAGNLRVQHPIGSGSSADVALRMAWLRNLRDIVRSRRGAAALRRFDAALLFGALVVSVLKVAGRRPTLGRPNIGMLRRYVLQPRRDTNCEPR